MNLYSYTLIFHNNLSFNLLFQPILNGRDSVRKVLDTFVERGGDWAKIATAYYGPVIENFSCEKTIYTAVEVSFTLSPSSNSLIFSDNYSMELLFILLWVSPEALCNLPVCYGGYFEWKDGATWVSLHSNTSKRSSIMTPLIYVWWYFNGAARRS